MHLRMLRMPWPTDDEERGGVAGHSLIEKCLDSANELGGSLQWGETHDPVAAQSTTFRSQGCVMLCRLIITNTFYY